MLGILSTGHRRGNGLLPMLHLALSITAFLAVMFLLDLFAENDDHDNPD